MCKYVCYMVNDFCAIGREFFGLSYDETEIVGYHDPNLALRFDTKQAGRDWLDKYMPNNKCAVGLYSLFAKQWDDWTGIYRTIPIKSHLSRPYNNETSLKVLDWWFEYEQNPDTVTYTDYVTWPNLCSLFTNIYNIVGYVDGRITVQMRVNRNDKYKTFAFELGLVLDRIGANAEGIKVLPIFEHTLSEHTSYTFEVYPNGKYAIGTTYSMTELMPLEECFEYWRKHHYYE